MNEDFLKIKAIANRKKFYENVMGDHHMCYMRIQEMMGVEDDEFVFDEETCRLMDRNLIDIAKVGGMHILLDICEIIERSVVRGMYGLNDVDVGPQMKLHKRCFDKALLLYASMDKEFVDLYEGTASENSRECKNKQTK